ncbi:2-amino-4-hydroxy-6-hydroxymethyldihydropteridinediphosphokinase [Flavobacteriaceae bacterium MAR_2010_188]|nr:2-amino-4-hydroxy-6-hydroxymethyldihydropteridinediphosphokinase [Flavobacteriaceae bacterium MAR_2010_188]
MENHSVYIGLGSNEGNRLANLQAAVDLIHRKIGKISIISEVYNSEAMGFDGAQFYNCCLLLETYFSAEETLNEILNIETDLGRKRLLKNQYESRSIDLDILFYDSEVIETENLTVPHPRLHNRKFVLLPLSKIARNFLHPNLNASIENLLLNLVDQSDVTPSGFWLKNPGKHYSFQDYNYIAIEGNIGAGKTSLAKMISQEFNAKLILERFADNPFLPKFYKEPKRYGFTLEMSFLADRYQQITDDLSQLDLFKDFIVSDYDVFKSLIFSKITLSEEEFKLYRKLFYLMYQEISKPDLYVYLYQDTERLKSNILKRGRDYESNIQAEYLNKINSGYLDYLKNHPDMNVKIINISEKDFVANREDYLEILEEITA